MKQKINIFFALLIMLFSYCSCCYCESPTINYTPYSTSLLRSEIKRNLKEFKEYRHFKNTPDGSDCAEPFLNADRYSSYYSDNFTMHKVRYNDFGGVAITITFESSQQLFWLWLYDINKDTWDLRCIDKYKEDTS